MLETYKNYFSFGQTVLPILKYQPVMTLMSSNSNNPEVAMNLQRATHHWAKL